MYGRRGNRDPSSEFGDPFAGLGDLRGHQSLISSFFGGRDPFDDPFFARPSGGMFESSFFGTTGSPFPSGFSTGLMNAHPSGFSTGSHLMNAHPFGFSTGSPLMSGQPSGFFTGSPLMNALPSGFATESPFLNAHPSGFLEHQSSQTNRSSGPIIEELNSDDEKDVEGKEEKKDNPRKHGRSSKGPYVEDPDDEIEGRKSKQLQYWNELKSVNNTQSRPQAHSFSFQSSTVTYGGSDGAYYTKSRTMRTGSDGVTIDDSKEADSTTGRAAHRLSRGIHDKGHTVTRNLQSDGRVDTMQVLHNLNEDELAGFEESWKGNARKHLPGWSERFNLQNGMGSGSSAEIGQQSRGGWALPSTERTHFSESMKPDMVDGTGSSRLQHSGRMRANIGDGTGSSRGRSRAARTTNNMDQVRRA